MSMIALKEVAEGTVALLERDFEDDRPTIHDPDTLAAALDYVANGGQIDDEGLDALRIAAIVLRGLGDLTFLISGVDAVQFGEYLDEPEVAAS